MRGGTTENMKRGLGWKRGKRLLKSEREAGKEGKKRRRKIKKKRGLEKDWQRKTGIKKEGKDE